MNTIPRLMRQMIIGSALMAFFPAGLPASEKDDDAKKKGVTWKVSGKKVEFTNSRADNSVTVRFKLSWSSMAGRGRKATTKETFSVTIGPSSSTTFTYDGTTGFGDSVISGGYLFGGMAVEISQIKRFDAKSGGK